MTFFKQTHLLSCIVFLYERSMYPFHSSVTRRQRLTEGVSEAWCFKKLFELFDSIIPSRHFNVDSPVNQRQVPWLNQRWIMFRFCKLDQR